MARHDAAVISEELDFLADLRAARDAEHAMPGAIELLPEQQAEEFRRAMARAPHSGREMAGPYVQSFYGEQYPDDATLPNWLAHASADHVLHFMSMHGEVRDALQRDPTVQATFLEARQQFMSGLHSGMRAGWITPFTNPGQRTNIHLERMEQATMRIGDIGETYLYGQDAFFDGPARMVVVAPGAGAGYDQRAADTHGRIAAAVPRVLAGIYGRGTAAWVRAGFAEHLSQVVHNGQQAVFDPSQRGERSPYAADQRALLGAVLAPGGAELARLFTLAMTSKDQSSAEWSAFREAFDQAWNVRDGFDAVSRYVNGLQDDFKHRHPDAVEIEHQQWAAETALGTLQHDPSRIFNTQEPAERVGVLAMVAGRRARGRGGHHA